MARYRKKASRRSYGRKARRSGKRSGKSFLGVSVMPILAAAGYGYARDKFLTPLVQPLVNALPMGNYADEAAMVIAAWGVGKFVPSMKPITNTAILIEAARIGSNLGGGNAPASGSSYFG